MSTHAWWVTDGVIWSLNLWLMGREKLDRWGSRLGWWFARWQLDRMHEAERLHGLQLHLELLRLGMVHDSPLMVSAAERERCCEVCGAPRWRCRRARLLDAGRPAPAGSCLLYEGDC